MDQPIWRILMVDDDQDDYLITKSLLDLAIGRRIILDWSANYEDGKAKIESNPYHAVLVDYDLGGKTGIEFIREAVASRYPAPLILYTGRGSYEVDLEAMSVGAALYLTKGEVNALLLERGIRYAIERKQSEQALRESQKSYQQLFSSMLDGFALHEIVCDETGKPIDYRFLEVNPAFERMTGLKAGDIVGKTVKDVLPETEDYWINIYGEVALTGKSIRLENYSGALGKHFEVVAFSPRPHQFATVFHDITERKISENALRSAQEELEKRVKERTNELRSSTEVLEKIFSSIHILVAFLDRDFNFIRVNEKYAQADGRDPGFFVGKNHFALYPNQENEMIFRQVVETGEPYTTFAKPFEYSEHHERGITYWDWSLQPVKEENGKVIALLLTIVDVTESQQTAFKLREYVEQAEGTAKLFEGLFQSTPVATLLVNKQGKILRVNRQAEITFGYDENELNGKSVDVLLPERVRTLHAARRLEYTNQPTLRSMGQRRSYAAQQKNGRVIPIDVILSPLQVGDKLLVICVMQTVGE